MRMTTICAGILLLVAPVYAASADTGPPDAASALARLKSLVGEWEGKSDMGEARLVYEAIAGGSAVVEREIVGEMPPRPQMHNATLRFLDDNHIESEWQFFENNRVKMTEKTVYARVR